MSLLFCVNKRIFEPQRPDILEELQKSQKVFAEKLNHLSRRLAWINATIYSKVAGLAAGASGSHHTHTGQPGPAVGLPQWRGQLPQGVLASSSGFAASVEPPFQSRLWAACG